MMEDACDDDRIVDLPEVHRVGKPSEDGATQIAALNWKLPRGSRRYVDRYR